MVDRASFPRDKLCGDTLNPGCLALLRALQLAGSLEGVGLDVAGMLVTGEGGVAVEGRYPHDLRGRSILRRDLDWALLGQAIAAGARFEPGVTVRDAVVLGEGLRPGVTARLGIGAEDCFATNPRLVYGG